MWRAARSVSVETVVIPPDAIVVASSCVTPLIFGPQKEITYQMKGPLKLSHLFRHVTDLTIHPVIKWKPNKNK